MHVEGYSEWFVVGWGGGTEQPGYLRMNTPLCSSGPIAQCLVR